MRAPLAAAWLLMATIAIGVAGYAHAQPTPTTSAQVSAEIVEPMGLAAPEAIVFAPVARPKDGASARSASAAVALQGPAGQMVQIAVSRAADPDANAAGGRVKLDLRPESRAVAMAGPPGQNGSAVVRLHADLSVAKGASPGTQTAEYAVHAVYE